MVLANPGASLTELTQDTRLSLRMISSRGTKVYPPTGAITDVLDHWRCRFMSPARGETVTHEQIISLLQRVTDAGFDFIKTENLYTFDDKAGADESVRVARDWIGKNAANTGAAAPTVSEGTVILQLK